MNITKKETMEERFDKEFGNLTLGILSGDKSSPVFVNNDLQVPRLKSFIHDERLALLDRMEGEIGTNLNVCFCHQGGGYAICCEECIQSNCLIRNGISQERDRIRTIIQKLRCE